MLTQLAEALLGIWESEETRFLHKNKATLFILFTENPLGASIKEASSLVRTATDETRGAAEAFVEGFTPEKMTSPLKMIP